MSHQQRPRPDSIVIGAGPAGFARPLDTSHPQVQRRLALRELGLRPFTQGVPAHTSAGTMRVTDPTRRPRPGGSLLPGQVLSARDLAALAALTTRDTLTAIGPGDVG